ncbi:MAG TPA: hypothetical protein VH682_05370 [Gemmataceae bacterium]
MNRSSRTHSVKPMLEQLEDRVQPSLLLGGNAVAQLVAPVDNALKDLQTMQTQLGNSTQGDFANAQAALKTLTTPAGITSTNIANFQVAFGKVVTDYRQMLNDQHTIQATANAATSFLNTAAFSELLTGDAVDFIILKFFPGSSFDPTTAFTKDVQQANDIMSSKDVTTDVGFDFNLPNALKFTPPTQPITIGSFAS